jgi:hypothetical protein
MVLSYLPSPSEYFNDNLKHPDLHLTVNWQYKTIIVLVRENKHCTEWDLSVDDSGNLDCELLDCDTA